MTAHPKRPRDPNQLAKSICRMGLEGIVSKRTDAPYRSGPSMVRLKNPASPAVRREREEAWR